MLAAMPSFPTTRWSLIAGCGDLPNARAAWSELALAYRPPILAYFRARFDASVAEDLTQAFFADSIAEAWWSRADPERGGFRTYLRTLLQRFGARHAPRVAVAAGREAPEPIDDAPTPERTYDRQFARTLVSRALVAVEAGLDAIDQDLWPFVLERGEPGEMLAIGSAHAISSDALRQRLHRLRRRVAASMQSEVAALTADPDRVDEELRAIRAALRS